MQKGTMRFKRRTVANQYTAALNDFSEQLKSANQGQSMSVVLIGSVARNTETPRSDVDVLILTEHGVHVPSTPRRFHVHQIDRDRMVKRLVRGDDFPAWCIRYGIPIWDSGLWAEIVNSEEARVWPDWRKKLPHAARRLLLGTTLLLTGDEDASAEEMLYSVTHIARALLLRSGVFPLSRAELVQQIEEAGYPHLAMLLYKLIHERTTLPLIRQAQSYAKKLLCYLDASAYRAVVLDQKSVLARKKQFRDKKGVK